MPHKKSNLKKTKIPGIYQDGLNRFLVRIRWTDAKTGKRRKREILASSLGEAVSLKENLREEEIAKPSRIRFRDYAENWLVNHSNYVHESSVRIYTIALSHILLKFSDYYLDGISTQELKSWVSELSGTAANPTLNLRLRVMRMILKEAVNEELIQKNPMSSIRCFPVHRTKGPRGTALSLEQFRLLQERIELLKKEKQKPLDSLRILQVLSWTGMRIGEALALRWSDISEGEILVSRSTFDGKEKTNKTDDPRKIFITEPLQKVFDEQKEWMVSTNHSGFFSGLVFPTTICYAKRGAKSRNSDQLNWVRRPAKVAKCLKGIIADLNLPEISLHSLRRTFENMQRLAGTDSLVRRSLAGWRDEATQAIYASVTKEERAAASTAFLRLVRGDEDGTPERYTQESGTKPKLKKMNNMGD